MSALKNVFIVAAKRTPFGTYGGKLAGFSATDLAVESSKAALAAGKVDPTHIDEVVFGNVVSASADGAYLARHVALRCGVPIPTPALSVNRLCGSGFQSAVSAYQSIVLGQAQVALVGGTESMSRTPHIAEGLRFGVKLGGEPKLQDLLWAALTDRYAGIPMGITAENLAEEYGITREEADAYALQSQQRWAKANETGVFDAEIAPIELKSRKGVEMFSHDEHARPDATLEKMSKLPAVFKKNGTVTAANASGICDGAASLILASEEAVKKYGYTPLARLSAYDVAGVDPSKMGIGPVPSIQNLLSKTGFSLSDIDLVEINEAFAPQYLSCAKVLGLDNEKSNVHGGAIALGHPLGASGARITAHLAHQIAGGKATRAIGSACIGGGKATRAIG
eukprot:CAMPEP_0174235886 /NCGR_PEP_ID=MMETSP0417-20130205/5189_1 /TAXON_ID=242541 /ORGANISM="Mayorella sp, Strain BSH-02190019" /LENGTH=393 /DNA_ID=CAMNT_0015314451 /DNA_START=66 /DNA_END=1243 /DNA_ORIENTATION=-